MNNEPDLNEVRDFFLSNQKKKKQEEEPASHKLVFSLLTIAFGLVSIYFAGLTLTFQWEYFIYPAFSLSTLPWYHAYSFLYTGTIFYVIFRDWKSYFEKAHPNLSESENSFARSMTVALSMLFLLLFCHFWHWLWF